MSVPTQSDRPTADAPRFCHAAVAVLALAALLIAGSASIASDQTTLKATYSISLAGLTIGFADVEGRFTDTRYAIIITGGTKGVSRLVSDASATLIGNGRISSRRLAPDSYDLETREGEFETHVRMKMEAGAITDLLTIPSLHHIPDRVPLEPRHQRNIVDPIAAFVVVGDKPGIASGRGICGRTIKIFDGWQRFDIRLAYMETRAVDGEGEAYHGGAVVCGARYVPIAGHRSSAATTHYMAQNERLEVWFVPIDRTKLLVPYRLLIGTRFGDLVIKATRFVVATGTPADEQDGRIDGATPR